MRKNDKKSLIIPKFRVIWLYGRFAFTEVTTTRYQGFFLYSSRPKTVLLSEEQKPYIIQRKTPITTVMLKLVNMSLKTTIYQ